MKCLGNNNAALDSCDADLTAAIRELYAENRDALWLTSPLTAWPPSTRNSRKRSSSAWRAIGLTLFGIRCLASRIAIDNDLATLTGLWVEEGVGYELWIGEGAVSLIRVRDYDSGNNVTLVKGPHAVIIERWKRELPA